VILEEFPEHKFSLSFFDYVEELTTEEVLKDKKDTLETQKVYLKNRNYIP